VPIVRNIFGMRQPYAELSIFGHQLAVESHQENAIATLRRYKNSLTGGFSDQDSYCDARSTNGK
jgi:hypothetical protein